MKWMVIGDADGGWKDWLIKKLYFHFSRGAKGSMGSPKAEDICKDDGDDGDDDDDDDDTYWQW